MSVSGRPLCPFNFNLDCAAFSCDSISLSGADVASGNRLATAIAIAGANGESNTRIIRLCVHSLIKDMAHPIGRLGNFRGVFLGTNRSGGMSFGVAPRLLGFCGCGLSFMYRSNSFRIVVNEGDRSMGGTTFGLLWLVLGATVYDVQTATLE